MRCTGHTGSHELGRTPVNFSNGHMVHPTPLALLTWPQHSEPTPHSAGPQGGIWRCLLSAGHGAPPGQSAPGDGSKKRATAATWGALGMAASVPQPLLPPGGRCGCGSQRASATTAIQRAVGVVVTRLAVLLDPGDSASQVVSTPAPRGYLGRNCPFTEAPPGISRPTRWALAAQSLRATSSSSASGAGAFSLRPSKYFPEMPSNSSATAR